MDYSLPNQNVAAIGQAAGTVAPNPLGTLGASINSGASLGLAMRAQQQAEAQQAYQQKALQDKLEQDRANKAIEYLTDKKYSRFLSKETKLKLFKDSAVPMLNKQYGLNINPDDISHDGGEDGTVENLLNLVRAGADPSIIKHEYMQAVSKSDPEELPMIKELGDTLFPKEGTPKTTQFTGFYAGKAMIYDPNTQSMSLVDLPKGGEGTFVPKTEPAKLEEQKIDNKQAINLINSIDENLKGVSGIGGGVSAMASKLTAGAIAPKLRLYQTQKPAIAAKLYRALTHDTRLSDQDAASRAMPLLPDPYEPADVQLAKTKALRDAAQGNNDALTQILTGQAPAAQATTPAQAPAKPIIQRNKKTGQVRISTDGGKTWQAQ